MLGVEMLDAIERNPFEWPKGPKLLGPPKENAHPDYP
jgi:hypothetical protein